MNCCSRFLDMYRKRNIKKFNHQKTNKMSDHEKYISVDVGKVIKSQKSLILRKMPRFIIRMIERIIYQKELNALLLSLKDHIGFDFIEGLVNYFESSTDVKGKENLPEHNHLIFVLNHPLGALDGITAINYLQKIYPDIKAITNNLLTNIKNALPIMLPVNSFGKTDPDSMKKIADTYESETNIFTFPAGRVSRIVGGKVRDKVWNKSFVVNARAYQREIVPIFIENINSKLFYRVYKIRRFLRIKTNLELFLLPHELFSRKNSVIKMKIGKAIPHTVFTDNVSEFDWAQKIKEHVYTFQEDHNKIFVA